MAESTATSIIGPIAIAAYIAYGIYGIRLEYRLERFKLATPPKHERWNPDYYAAKAAPLLRKNRLWERLRTPVWLGLPLVAYLLIRLFSS